MEKQSGLLPGTKGSLTALTKDKIVPGIIFSPFSLPDLSQYLQIVLWFTAFPPPDLQNSRFIISTNQSSGQLASARAAREAVWGGVKSSAVSFYCIHYSDLQKRRLVYLRVSSVEIFIKGEKKMVGLAGWGRNLLLRVFHLSLVLFHTFGSRINCRI